jgi:hypothetical protein
VGGFKKISSSKGLETKSKKFLFISLEGTTGEIFSHIDE